VLTVRSWWRSFRWCVGETLTREHGRPVRRWVDIQWDRPWVYLQPGVHPPRSTTDCFLLHSDSSQTPTPHTSWLAANSVHLDYTHAHIELIHHSTSSPYSTHIVPWSTKKLQITDLAPSAQSTVLCNCRPLSLTLSKIWLDAVCRHSIAA